MKKRLHKEKKEQNSPVANENRLRKGRPQDGDTICSLATPPGQGALALIRLSGNKAFGIIRKCCPFLPKNMESHRVYFGAFLHPENKDILDEVLVFCFETGRSFTGEESVEISCHGGSYLSSVIIEALITAGARLAERGEFSYRAFMNGKMDLVQAESVLDLIQSRSPKAHKQAIKGLRGKLSKYLTNLEERLVKLLSHLEASIDFSDQETQPFSVRQQRGFLEEVRREVKKAIESFHQGRIDREGFSIILLGASNAGKSSLFNYLIQDDKAIVTKYPGTTRDILSARILLDQRELCLKDTAGFRENPDPVESQGIKKTLEEVHHSDLCLFLVESNVPLKKESFFGLEALDPECTTIVFSKSDQLSKSEKEIFLQKLTNLCRKEPFIKKFLKTTKTEEILWLSSRTGEKMENLKQLFCEKAGKETEEGILFTSRQKEALENMSFFLDQARKLLDTESSPEFVVFELQQVLSILYQLLGKEYNEEVIKQIFKEFCLGK